MTKIKMHRDLKVYQLSFAAAMEIFNLTKKFPKEETYSLTDQMRRSSRSVSSNLVEALENEDIQSISYLNLPIVKEKPLKPKLGLIIP